jgi:hypothetical protein
MTSSDLIPEQTTCADEPKRPYRKHAVLMGSRSVKLLLVQQLVNVVQ